MSAEQDVYPGTPTPEGDEVRRLTREWLRERGSVPTCPFCGVADPGLTCMSCGKATRPIEPPKREGV